MALAEEKGLEMLVVVHVNPPGVSFDNRHESYRRFAQFMADMAPRFPQIRFWELWKELVAGFTDLFGVGQNRPNGDS